MARRTKAEPARKTRRVTERRPLTETQRTVHALLLEGLDVQQIAKRTGMSPSSVYNHRRGILERGHSIEPNPVQADANGHGPSDDESMILERLGEMGQAFGAMTDALIQRHQRHEARLAEIRNELDKLRQVNVELHIEQDELTNHVSLIERTLESSEKMGASLREIVPEVNN